MEPKKVLNKTRILVWGINRSGNHAIINWILAQYEEPKMFLNNQIFGKELTAAPKKSLTTLGVEHFESQQVYYSQKDQKDWQNVWNNPQEGTNQLILISFESKDISLIDKSKYQIGTQSIDNSVVGKSLSTINVIVIRDLFNWWASCIKVGMLQKFSLDYNLWKIYAKEYLSETNYLPNKVCIDYNNWFMNQSYRKVISKKLGVNFSDKGLNLVSDRGGGSSFDKREFEGKAQAMNVLNRWEQLENGKLKKNLLRKLWIDRDMNRLVKTIYPDLYQKYKSKKIWQFF